MRVIIESDYQALSQWAANYVASKINAANPTPEKPFVLGCPTGSSPLGMYKALIELNKQGKVSFQNVVTFNMDEYVGFGIDDTRSFQHFLSEAIFSRVPFKSVNLINGANDPDAEAARYGTLLDKAPTHIAFMGIGENGHIAFNDPPTANFRDEVSVKKVQLDEICRQQQINDGCFLP